MGEIIMTFEKVVSQQGEKIKELEARVNKNSRNSSKPPSSDGYSKKPTTTKAKKDKKKNGGQSGHKGNTLKMVDHPDKVIELKPQLCICGYNLKDVSKKLLEKRQLFEIPPPELYIQEYQSYSCDCPNCHITVYQPFPEKIKAPVQYGSGVKTLVTLLNNKYHLSYQRIKELFGDLYGYEINDSTQKSILDKAYENLDDAEEQIKTAILNSPIAHADETGIRVSGKLQWLHNLSTQLYTYIFCHQKRGSDAIESEKSILLDYEGTLIHDCYSSYFKLLQCQHGICNAHIIRELESLKESGANWAASMQDLLLYLNEKKLEKGQQLIEGDRFCRQYDRICKIADEYEPPPIKGKRGRPKKSKGRNLLERLVKYKEAVLLFAVDPDIPFTNNLAERDIRPAKIKMKNAGCFRTQAGADKYSRIHSFLSTLRKLKRNVFDELYDIFEGHSFDIQFDTPK